MIDIEKLKSDLTESVLPWEIEYVASIDSTNDEVSRRFGGSEISRYMLLWAEEQVQGRGRLKRTWVSHPGLDVTVSVIFPAPVPPSDIPKLSLCAGLALVNVLRSNYGINSLIRWPNDVLTQNGKLAGILSTYLALPHAVICGIGINVNSESGTHETDQHTNSTSISSELGHSVTREKLVASWLTAFEKTWILAEADNIHELRERFDSVSYYKGHKVKVIPGAASRRELSLDSDGYEAIADSINPDGALLVHTDCGLPELITVDDVLIPLD